MPALSQHQSYLELKPRVTPEMLCGFKPESRKPYHFPYPGLKFTSCGWEYKSLGEKTLQVAPPAWALAVSAQNAFLDTLESRLAMKVRSLYMELIDAARSVVTAERGERVSLTKVIKQKELGRDVKLALRKLLECERELQNADTAHWGSMAANCSELRAVTALLRALS